MSLDHPRWWDPPGLPQETSATWSRVTRISHRRVEAREANRPLAPEMLLYLRQKAFETWLTEEWHKATIERFIDM
jgi:hypothetical protein